MALLPSETSNEYSLFSLYPVSSKSSDNLFYWLETGAILGEYSAP